MKHLLPTLFLLISFLPLHAEHHAGQAPKELPKKTEKAKQPDMAKAKARLATISQRVDKEHDEWARLDREYHKAMKNEDAAAAERHQKTIEVLKKKHEKSHFMQEKLTERIALLEKEGSACASCEGGACATEKCQPGGCCGGKAGCKGGDCKAGECKAGECKAGACDAGECAVKAMAACCGGEAADCKGGECKAGACKAGGCCGGKAADCKGGECAAGECKAGKCDGEMANKPAGACKAGECHGEKVEETMPAPKLNGEIKSLEEEARELVEKAEALQKRIEALQKEGAE